MKDPSPSTTTDPVPLDIHSVSALYAAIKAEQRSNLDLRAEVEALRAEVAMLAEAVVALRRQRVEDNAYHARVAEGLAELDALDAEDRGRQMAEDRWSA